MIFFLRLWVLLICFITASHAAEAAVNTYHIKPMPNWVKPATYSADIPNIEQQALNYLLMDDQVNTTKVLQKFRHRVIKPLTTVGVEQVSEIKLDFNPAFESLNIHQITIKRDNTIRDLTNSANIRVIHREEQLSEGIQDGQATAIIILDDVRIGDIIDYSYSTSGSNPIFDNKSFGFLTLDAPIAINTLNIRLLSNTSKKLYVNLFNNKDIKLEQTTSGDITEYSIHQDNIKAIEAEESTPAWFSPYSWLEYSEYDSWASVDKWAQTLYSAPIKPSAIFESTYKTLSAKSPNTESFITNALFFVQNDIRYLGLEFGENSHKPHSPADVLQTRYGDCKDKALLLSKLLQRHGITAYPALVSTQFQKGIIDELPSPGLFNHVITYVDYDGKHYWLDGTRRYQAGSLATIGTQDFGLALVIGHPDKKLIDMYADDTPKQAFEVEEHFYAQDFTSPIDYEVITTLYNNSAEAQREYFANHTPSEIRTAFANFYSHFHDDLSINKPLDYQDDRVNNRFTIHEHYKIDKFWETTNSNNQEYLKAPIVLTAFSDQLYSPKSVDRKTPLYMPSPRIITSRVYVHLPTDVKLSFDGKPAILEDKAMRFTSVDRYADKTYYGQAELVITQDYVAPERFKDFQKHVHDTKNQWEYTIFFPAPNTTGYPEISTLKNLIQSVFR